MKRARPKKKTSLFRRPEETEEILDREESAEQTEEDAFLAQETTGFTMPYTEHVSAQSETEEAERDEDAEECDLSEGEEVSEMAEQAEEVNVSETFEDAEAAEEERVTLEDKLHRKEQEKKRKKRQKLVILAAAVCTLVMVFVVVMGMGGFFSDHAEIKEEITEEQLVTVDKSTGKINVLILGVDKEGLRTDTMIVASYDLDDNRVKLLSIPRDTRMYVGSRYQKINAAHAITQSGKIKGPQGSIEAVTRLTTIPINYYVEFSFDAFKKTIDALGGVDFYVPRNMDYEDPVQDLYIHLKEGQQHLDGDKAEQLVRFRRYPEGDIARVHMQQEFIKAVAQQKLNAGIITKLPDLFDVLKDEIKTNFTVLDLSKYIGNLMELQAESVTMYQLPGDYSGAEYDASYWLADMAEVRTLIQNEFGYDAEKATNGPAGSKGEETKKPARATQKATVAPKKATKAPSKTVKPDQSAEPTEKATKKPSVTEAPTTKPTAKPTEKATAAPQTEVPTAKPTPKPTEQATEAPKKTEAPEQTPRPARPTAKPTEAPAEE